MPTVRKHGKGKGNAPAVHYKNLNTKSVDQTISMKTVATYDRRERHS
jgi:hypothetical protein